MDSGNADAAKRLVAAYIAVGNKLANDAETQTKEVLSFTQIWNLEPHMRAMLEEDRHWVAANARYLAKVARAGSRGALEAAAYASLPLTEVNENFPKAGEGAALPAFHPSPQPPITHAWRYGYHDD